MLWQLICENLLPLGNTSCAAHERRGKPSGNSSGNCASKKGRIQLVRAPATHKNNDNMVYEYFQGKSGDGPLVLRFKKRDGAGDQVAVAVNNLIMALFDRGLYMDSTRRRVTIAIYREDIKPTTMWWEYQRVEYESADTN